MRRDLTALTSLRGLAAWWVVFYHIRAMLKPYLGDRLFDLARHGDLAVDMFFVLSGFVMFLNYADRLKAGGMADFMYRRFARVYPLHLAILVAYALFIAAAVARGGDTSDYGLGYFVASLTMVQNWGFTDTLAWNVPAWSISTEWAAYLLFPLLLLAVDWRKRPTWELAAWLALLGIGLHGYLAALGLPFPGSEAVPQTGLVRCLVQFTMGTILCALYLRLGPRLALPMLAAAMGFIALRLGLDAPVVPLIWAALILGFALWEGNPLTWRPFVYLGDTSYAVYLVHYLAFILFKIAFVEEGATVLPALIALYIAGVFGAAVVLYHLVERPAQRWLLARKPLRLSAAPTR